jgi:hypothetical protein
MKLILKSKICKPNPVTGRPCSGITNLKGKLSQVSQYAAIILTVLLFAACRQDMHDQPRYEPLESNAFFNDGRASRPRVEGTVARGHLKTDAHLFTGKVGGQLVRTFPFPVTDSVMVRGEECFNIFCTPCHDKLGNGNGLVVQRGMRQPPSFHIERLRNEPVGHFYDVITNGLGSMYGYSGRLKPEDRWAVVAYIRALQLSQNISIDAVSEQARQKLLEIAEP